MEPIRNGTRDFVPLDQLHRENLITTLPEFGLDPSDYGDELDDLTAAWERLDPWDDSVAGLAELARHVIVGPLSNANLALLLRMGLRAGLPWTVIIGSDVTRAYKPDPEAYRNAAHLLRLDPGEVMLAAAHNHDLAAAQRAGLGTAFIPRPTEFGPGQTKDLAAEGDWDLVCPSIVDLAGAFPSDWVTSLTSGTDRETRRPPRARHNHRRTSVDRTVAVTGGSGKLGRAVVAALIEQGGRW